MARTKKTMVDLSALAQLPLDTAQRQGLAQALEAPGAGGLQVSLDDAQDALRRLDAINVRFAALRRSTKMTLTVDKLPAYAVMGAQQMNVSE